MSEIDETDSSRTIARMQHDLHRLKRRREALQTVYESISGDSFTDGERDAVDRDVRECDAEISETELSIADRADFMQTTLAKCSSDIVERQNVLNVLFSNEVMREHQAMMRYFAPQQQLLTSIVHEETDADAKRTRTGERASDFDDDND